MTTSAANRVTLDAQGRIVIPADIRNQRGWKPGDRLVFREIDGLLVVMTYDEALQRAQDLVIATIPRDVSLVDELIAERRAAAARGD